MDKLPLDARLLSNAVMELNIARHILGLYPREHQLVQASLDRAFALLTELFELRSEITLAVAKDTLIVDGRRLDAKHPVYREFALALSRMGIALVSFVKGATKNEVYSFFRLLSGEPAGLSAETLPQILAAHGLRHILVQAMDYGAFAFAADRTRKGGADPWLLERHLKNLLDGGISADGARQLTDGLEPDALAGLLNRTGGALAHEVAYDTVVSSYLRGGSGRVFSSGDLQRLMDFIDGLRPELKRQFLASSIQAFASDPAALNQALEGVSVDRIIGFFGEIDRSEVRIPETLTTLISRFARTGVELPGGGLNVDDVLLSRDVADLFRPEEGGEQAPDSYREEVRRLLEAPAARHADAAGPLLEQELDDDYVAYCHADALLALLESSLPQLITLEDEAAYAQSFAANAARAVETAQYGQLFELLQRIDELGRRGCHPAVVGATRDACSGVEFVGAVVDSICRHGRANRTGAAMICSWYGAAIAAPLFDRLAGETRAHVRRLLLQLLAGLGGPAVVEATRRLRDRRWYVRRNALSILAESGVGCDPQHLLRAAKDPDARVRLECARCLLRAGDPSGVGLLRALLRDPEPGVSDAAAAIGASAGAADLLPDLAALAKRLAGSAGGRRRLRLIRALGQLGGDEAVRALEGLLAQRAPFFASGQDRFRAEVGKALRRIADRRAGESDGPDAPKAEGGR